jgi:hypothetical protein
MFTCISEQAKFSRFVTLETRLAADSQLDTAAIWDLGLVLSRVRAILHFSSGHILGRKKAFLSTGILPELITSKGRFKLESKKSKQLGFILTNCYVN